MAESDLCVQALPAKVPTNVHDWAENLLLGHFPQCLRTCQQSIVNGCYRMSVRGSWQWPCPSWRRLWLL